MELEEALKKETVGTIGYRELVAIDARATVRAAVERMQQASVGCIVVVDGEELRGIFTERDLVQRVLGPGVGLDTPLVEVMTFEPFTVHEDEPIHRALARMRRRGLRHLPVVGRDGAPAGTISIKRALHFLASFMPQAVYNLPPEPDRYPARAEGG